VKLLQIYLLALSIIVSASLKVYPQTYTSGSLQSFVTTIVNYIPGSGTNAFIIPTSAQMSAFEQVFSTIINKNYSAVQSLVTPYGYTFYQFYETQWKDTLYILKENTPVQRGWGTYIVNPSSQSTVTFEIPHPLWDTYSWRLGLNAYLACNAKWYILAGTHRYANTDSSSDMAHVTQSIFHTAHKLIAPPYAVQIHGFDGSSPQYTGYPDAVISGGTLYPTAIFYTLRDQYIQKGFTAGVFSYSTYSQLSLLGATTNVQGKWSNNNGRVFIHIEHDQPLRFDTLNSRKVINALAGALSTLTAAEDLARMNEGDIAVSVFPNPSNPSAVIRCSLPQKRNISLTLYNTAGCEVMKLFSGELAGGIHTIRFNSQMLASGIYFCVAESRDFRKTVKVIVMH
jgi:hypothetical protein